MSKNTGILGSGMVGITLANGLKKYGYDVMIGTNDTSKHEKIKSKTNRNITIGTFEEVAKHGSIIILAVKGNAASEALKKAGYENLSGKTIIDATNPISDAPPVNGVLKFITTLDNSLMEQLQKEVPAANFVKAFNSVGNALMVNPDYGNVKPTMFICGNNEASKKEVKEILDLFGWETEDMGTAEAARAIEPLCMLWCIPGFKNNQWNHAFKLLKK
ncbi:MAG TPA: NAD(P)-binding domain-containing protein [Bacteroidia bacterium]|nr:NAD(P)-binding domain-containing protein [Bacteroidia bacterium]HNU33947.1 NAD(P)-binding domain-containing protein [Bacteroidia bacterium]